jgi:hypothetical protein
MAATRAIPRIVPTIALPELSVSTVVVVGGDGGVIIVVIKILLVPRGGCVLNLVTVHGLSPFGDRSESEDCGPPREFQRVSFLKISAEWEP